MRFSHLSAAVLCCLSWTWTTWAATPTRRPTPKPLPLPAALCDPKRADVMVDAPALPLPSSGQTLFLRNTTDRLNKPLPDPLTPLLEALHNAHQDDTLNSGLINRCTWTGVPTPGLVYRFNATGSPRDLFAFHARAEDFAWDIVLAVVSCPSGTLIDCNDDGPFQGDPVDYGPAHYLNSFIEYEATSNTVIIVDRRYRPGPFLVLVTGFAGSKGSFTLNITHTTSTLWTTTTPPTELPSTAPTFLANCSSSLIPITAASTATEWPSLSWTGTTENGFAHTLLPDNECGIVIPQQENPSTKYTGHAFQINLTTAGNMTTLQLQINFAQGLGTTSTSILQLNEATQQLTFLHRLQDQPLITMKRAFPPGLYVVVFSFHPTSPQKRSWIPFSIYIETWPTQLPSLVCAFPTVLHTLQSTDVDSDTFLFNSTSPAPHLPLESLCYDEFIYPTGQVAIVSISSEALDGRNLTLHTWLSDSSLNVMVFHCGGEAVMEVCPTTLIDHTEFVLGSVNPQQVDEIRVVIVAPPPNTEDYYYPAHPGFFLSLSVHSPATSSPTRAPTALPSSAPTSSLSLCDLPPHLHLQGPPTPTNTVVLKHPKFTSTLSRGTTWSSPWEQSAVVACMGQHLSYAEPNANVFTVRYTATRDAIISLSLKWWQLVFPSGSSQFGILAMRCGEDLVVGCKGVETPEYEGYDEPYATQHQSTGAIKLDVIARKGDVIAFVIWPNTEAGQLITVPFTITVQDTALPTKSPSQSRIAPTRKPTYHPTTPFTTCEDLVADEEITLDSESGSSIVLLNRVLTMQLRKTFCNGAMTPSFVLHFPNLPAYRGFDIILSSSNTEDMALAVHTCYDGSTSCGLDAVQVSSWYSNPQSVFVVVNRRMPLSNNSAPLTTPFNLSITMATSLQHQLCYLNTPQTLISQSQDLFLVHPSPPLEPGPLRFYLLNITLPSISHVQLNFSFSSYFTIYWKPCYENAREEQWYRDDNFFMSRTMPMLGPGTFMVLLTTYSARTIHDDDDVVSPVFVQVRITPLVLGECELPADVTISDDSIQSLMLHNTTLALAPGTRFTTSCLSTTNTDVASSGIFVIDLPPVSVNASWDFHIDSSANDYTCSSLPALVILECDSGERLCAKHPDCGPYWPLTSTVMRETNRPLRVIIRSNAANHPFFLVAKPTPLANTTQPTATPTAPQIEQVDLCNTTTGITHIEGPHTPVSVYGKQVLGVPTEKLLALETCLWSSNTYEYPVAVLPIRYVATRTTRLTLTATLLGSDLPEGTPYRAVNVGVQRGCGTNAVFTCDATGEYEVYGGWTIDYSDPSPPPLEVKVGKYRVEAGETVVFFVWVQHPVGAWAWGRNYNQYVPVHVQVSEVPVPTVKPTRRPTAKPLKPTKRPTTKPSVRPSTLKPTIKPTA